MARNAEHGGEDALIPNGALAQLPFDHLLAAQDEFSFPAAPCGKPLPFPEALCGSDTNLPRAT